MARVESVAAMRLPLLLCLLGGLLPPGTARADLSAELRRLASDRASDRAAAQRWLAAHLQREDLAPLADALRDGGAEARKRLVQALGSADRHLELCVLVASDHDRVVADAGREALLEQVTRWSTSARDEPDRARRVPERWDENWTRRLSLEVGRADLARAVDRLDRLGAGPAPLVLDPGLDPSLDPLDAGSERPVGDAGHVFRAEGRWTELLDELARRQKVTFEVLGARAPHEPGAFGARPWVRVALRSDAGAGTGAQHLVDWCLGVVREYDPRWNAACARALATVGWPAALRWLEERWTRDGDPAALDGLLVAAERGRVAPSLARPAAVRALLDELDRRAREEGDAALGFVERAARALGALGSMAFDGRPLEPVFLEGFEDATPRGQWARLVALEGGAREDAAAAEACRALLAREGAPPALRWQALRTLAAVRNAAELGAPPRVAEPEALLAWAAPRALSEEAGLLLVAVGARAEPAPGLDFRSPADAAARLVWALARGDRGAADRLLLEALPDPGRPAVLAEGLEAWIGLGWRQDLDRWLDDLLAAAPVGDPRRPALTSFGLRAGLGGPELRAEALERVLALPPLSRGARAWEDLGELAGGADDSAAGARVALSEALRAGLDVPSLPGAIERAVRRFPADRSDERDSFLAALRSSAIQSGHALAAPMLRADWPPEVQGRARRLEAQDRVWSP